MLKRLIGFQNKAGTDATRDELLSRMKEHINTVAGRYGEDIGAWDVVNEALNEDGSMRDSKWRQIIGDDFIAKAFEFSALAAPNSKLYYNDYNLFKPEKREGVIKLVKQLQAKGIRIDGIGIQGHYALDYPDLQQLEDSIVAFAALGVDVMLTELDVSVLPFPDEENQGADISLDIELQDKYNPYPNGLPNDVNEQLAQRYHEIFALLAKHKEKIGRVTFWGVHDGQTWRNGWPMSGRSDYPLFFDRNLTLKSFVADLPK